jgi:phage terminase large subunit
MSVSLPNNWEARHYQRDLFRWMLTGGLDGKRAVCVWHRRAGKDSCALNLAAVASQMRVGTVWHMLPEATPVSYTHVRAHET